MLDCDLSIDRTRLVKNISTVPRQTMKFTLVFSFIVRQRGAYPVESESCEEVRGSRDVKVFEGQMLHVGKWNREVVYSDAALSLARGVEQRALNVEVARVSAGGPVRVLTVARERAVYLLYLISYDSIAID